MGGRRRCAPVRLQPACCWQHCEVTPEPRPLKVGLAVVFRPRFQVETVTSMEGTSNENNSKEPVPEPRLGDAVALVVLCG